MKPTPSIVPAFEWSPSASASSGSRRSPSTTEGASRGDHRAPRRRRSPRGRTHLRRSGRPAALRGADRATHRLPRRPRRGTASTVPSTVSSTWASTSQAGMASHGSPRSTSTQPPTAVFAVSDELAFGAMAETRRRGLAVPGDVAVVGFDDHPAGRAARSDHRPPGPLRRASGEPSCSRQRIAMRCSTIAGETTLELRAIHPAQSRGPRRTRDRCVDPRRRNPVPNP